MVVRLSYLAAAAGEVEKQMGGLGALLSSTAGQLCLPLLRIPYDFI